MIYSIGECKASVKQNSKGFWYVDELSVSGNSISDSIELLDAAMYKTVLLLEKYNTVEEDTKSSSKKK